MKKVIRLTESDLHGIVNASVRRVLREYESDDDGAYFNRNSKKHYGKGPDELYWDDDDFNDDEGDRLINLHCSKNRRRKPMLKEAENGGWVVDATEARNAYELAAREMGKDTIDSAIIRSLTDEQLAQCLAYIFRMYDFREWEQYQNNINDDEEMI